MRRLFSTSLFALVYFVCLQATALASTPCDFDGDGMSELVVVNLNDHGTYDWTAFNPRLLSSRIIAQSLGSPVLKLIPGNWIDRGKAIAAIVDPVGPRASDRATWTVKSIDYLGGVAVSKNLGRSGDIIIQGGDYDGNGITDSLILKRTTGMLGLRVNYFLSGYNGNNLGRERLYKALGSPFRDKNFFFSPDGRSDYLAVLQRRGAAYRVLLLKPFTDSPQVFDVGTLPGGAHVPWVMKQGPGRADLLAFSTVRGGETQIVVKSLAGREIYRSRAPGTDGVSVGDFLSDPGWEIGIENGETVTIINPLTRVSRSVTRPPGKMVRCISNQTIK
jgi:hypothetical protein